MTLRHVVTWKLAAEDASVRAAQAAEVARLLNALKGVVPEILEISAGANSLYPEANWDVTLIADFADAAALEAYQVHPAHVEAAGYIKSVVGGRVAVDFEV
ncbi:Dabb family protein [Microbacterium sp. NPDC055903]